MRLGIDASNIHGGGGLTHLVELLRAAQPEQSGIEQVVVWTSRAVITQLPEHSWLIPLHEPILNGHLPQRFLWQQTRLSKKARQNCDVLFVPGGTFLGRFTPFIAMSQNLLPFDTKERRRFGFSPTRLRLELLKITQTMTFHRASGIVFLTQTAKQVVERQTRRLFQPIQIIPHGIAKRFNRAPCDEKPLSAFSWNQPFKWLYVSIVDVYKNQWRVAEAIAQLRREGLPVELDLVGPAYPSALRQLRRTIKRLDPEESFIHYRGAVAYEELNKYYHQANGFVFASSCENLPNILIEAMSASLPIASSNRGPMPEILENAGMYFDPERADQIAIVLRELTMSTKLRSQFSSLAYKLSMQYSWERCARETFDFIRRTVTS